MSFLTGILVFVAGFLVGFFIGIQPKISRPAEAKADEIMNKWRR